MSIISILIIVVVILFFVKRKSSKKGTSKIIKKSTVESINNENANITAIIKPKKSGVFSVSPTKKVHFALGNLEYNESYRFTKQQYDLGGYFGWGTGKNPTIISSDHSDYSIFDDWGNNKKGGWYTLSSEEWEYVLSNRPNAFDKWGGAIVCGVNGLILLPDHWDGGLFHPNFDKGWNTNVYDAVSWNKMETAGAIFLPAAGFRNMINMRDVGNHGYYWSSSSNDDYYAQCIRFHDVTVYYNDIEGRPFGLSVRLVQDVTEE